MFSDKKSALIRRVQLLSVLEMLLIVLTFQISNEILIQSGLLQQEYVFSVWQVASFLVVIQASMLSFGLYTPKTRETVKGIFTRILASVSFGTVGLLIINPFIIDMDVPSALMSAMSMITFATLFFLRFILNKVEWLGRHKRNVLVLGTGSNAAYIEKRMRRDYDRQGFKLTGFVKLDTDSQKGITKEKMINIPQSGLVIYALENDVDEIVLAPDDQRNAIYMDELVACKIKGIEIIDMCDFVEREMGQIPTDMMLPSKIALSNGFRQKSHAVNFVDWLLNAVLGFILIVLTAPIMIITALLIKLEDGWSAPVFYSQERVGLNGATFSIRKFRSMKLDAEKDGAKMASENDNRITKVGNYIRKFRIDELPQVFNIMQGDMGFVGPRPERPVFVEDLVTKYDYFDERHNVRPGLTGWAQLKYPYGASDNDSFEKLKFDLYYIKHRTLLLDLLIIARTVEIVLFGKGR